MSMFKVQSTLTGRDLSTVTNIKIDDQNCYKLLQKIIMAKIFIKPVFSLQLLAFTTAKENKMVKNIAKKFLENTVAKKLIHLKIFAVWLLVYFNIHYWVIVGTVSVCKVEFNNQLFAFCCTHNLYGLTINLIPWCKVIQSPNAKINETRQKNLSQCKRPTIGKKKKNPSIARKPLQGLMIMHRVLKMLIHQIHACW